MANKKHLTILKSGVKAWNKWREKTPEVRPDLSATDLGWAVARKAGLIEADLNGANLFATILSGADLRRADLRRADLRKTDFRRVNLEAADINGANLREADLRGADLRGADLSWAALSGAILIGADLSRTILIGADLSGALLGEANLSQAFTGYSVFTDIDLSQTKGLDTVQSRGPSYIDTHTLHKSQSQIPEFFLRSCGFSDWEIENTKLYQTNLDPVTLTDILYKIHQLRDEGVIQLYSCFISYTNKDETCARQLHDDLQNNSVRCWFAPENMKIGDEIRPRIDQSIRLHDKLLLILSKNSIKSHWVKDEVENALNLERERGKSVLLPIRLDDAVMKSDVWWARQIRDTRHIGDFTHWQDEGGYQEGFGRLLEDLKAEG